MKEDSNKINVMTVCITFRRLDGFDYAEELVDGKYYLTLDREGVIRTQLYEDYEGTPMFMEADNVYTLHEHIDPVNGEIVAVAEIPVVRLEW